MSLNFAGGSGRYVNCGSNAVIDNLTAGTVLAWVYSAAGATSNSGVVWAKDGGGVYKYFSIPYYSGNRHYEFAWKRATSDLYVGCTTDQFAAFGLNKWLCVGTAWDTAGSNGDQHLWCGDLTTALAEPTSYNDSQAVGSGAPGNEASNSFYIGNFSTGTQSWDGRIAVVALFNRKLTLAEAISWQFSPRMLPGCVGFWRLGENGTGTQRDLSGNANHGTVTSATAGTFAPLPFPE